jgi:hypothetical protein
MNLRKHSTAENNRPKILCPEKFSFENTEKLFTKSFSEKLHTKGNSERFISGRRNVILEGWGCKNK